MDLDFFFFRRISLLLLFSLVPLLCVTFSFFVPEVFFDGGGGNVSNKIL